MVPHFLAALDLYERFVVDSPKQPLQYNSWKFSFMVINVPYISIYLVCVENKEIILGSGTHFLN